MNLVDHLPHASHLVEAWSQDDEIAASLGESNGPRVEHLHEWTLEARIAADLFDRMGTLISVLMQVNNNKAPHLPSYPRPVTATQRLAAARSREVQTSLHARLYPEGG